MRSEQWRKVEEVYHSSLERDEEQRSAFVAAACAGDEQLRCEVESLLAHQGRAEHFMETPAFEVAARSLFDDEFSQDIDEQPLIGSTISHYRLVEKLGAGGMGEVYRAVRDDGTYEKQVAIKVMRSGLGTGYFVARFKTERQILARLDHPHIASILDAGSTADGVHYVVMEYVAGLPIDEYCRRNQSAVPDRLKLFWAVCLAVQYAHQNLVLHRDLKPGNILVTPQGEPKLLDFGIAKIVNSVGAGGSGESPATALPMMTPEYASPEQIRNGSITTASDIYSLGVILYKLLCGRLPFHSKDASGHDLANAICETEPDKPSSVARHLESRDTAIKRSQEKPEFRMRQRSSALAKVLAGDLDNIVLKALRKEPARRYASAAHLSEDVRRYLEGLPVTAHKDTLGYRAGKFVRKEKKIVTAVALLVLSLAGGMIASLREARIARRERARAERRFNDVRTLADSLVFDVNDAIKDLPGSTSARELVVGKALTYLDGLAQEANGDLSLQRELAAAYERVGEVQGSVDDSNLGNSAGALASFKKAAAIRETIAAGEHNSPESLSSLANVYEMLSRMLSGSGQYQGALEYAQKTLAIRQQLDAAGPTPESREGLAGAYYVLGLSQSALDDLQDALSSLQESAAVREAIASAPPALYAEVRTRLSGTYGELSVVLSQMNKPAQAIAAARRGLEVMNALAAAHPDNRLYREYAYEHTEVIGDYFEALGDHAQAQSYYKRALAGFQATSSSDPNDANSKLWLGECESSLGKVQIESGEIAPGLENVRNGLQIALALYRADPTENNDKLTDLADAYAASGFAYAHLAERHAISNAERTADWEHARDQYQQSANTWHIALQLHVVAGPDAGKPEQVSKELARCNAALARRKST
jgi:eukaryotic-like serine/threonine-protein kinase